MARRVGRDDLVMTATEAARLLQVHVKTLYRLASQGAIPAVRIGRGWRFNRRDLLALVSHKEMRKPTVNVHNVARGAP